MSRMARLYWPNPAHKRDTSEAGPPRWRPDKTPCPTMTVEERDELLSSSVPLDANDPTSRRYALRMGLAGPEWFEGRFTQYVREDLVFHGFPTEHVPARVLRQFRDRGVISNAQYRMYVKRLG